MKQMLVVIPAYNEEDNIERVVKNIRDNYSCFDYVVINDGSKDNTEKICRENNFNLINLPINLGLSGGFQTGLKYAYEKGYDYAIQYDADGQHRAEYIAPMLDKMKQGDYDIVIGSRFVEEKKPHSLRMLGSNLISFIIKLTTGTRIQDPTSGMRILNREMIKQFAKGMDFGPEPDTISYLIKCGARVEEVQVKMDERIAGTSYLNFSRSIKYMIRMIFSIMFIQIFRKKKRFHN